MSYQLLHNSEVISTHDTDESAHWAAFVFMGSSAPNFTHTYCMETFKFVRPYRYNNNGDTIQVIYVETNS